jgi:N-acetylmuramoyl-L-alanine amidase
MTKVCIQAGHWNKSGGGAPEEQSNNKRIADRLSALLRERGFEVYQTDYFANNDPKVTSVDYNLFLALHCDMDYPDDNGSGFADYPEPLTDIATVESQRICKVINEVYFPEVKINYVNHSNANTRYYYMWKSLTAKTPCVLVEMGQSVDPHDKVLLANTELIAGALCRAICIAFGVPYDLPTLPPTPPQNPPSEPTVPYPDYTDDHNNLLKVREIVYGRGWPWTKINKIKLII